MLRTEVLGALTGQRGLFKAAKQIQPRDSVEADCGEDAEALYNTEILRGSGFEADGAHKHHGEGNGSEDCYRADTPVLQPAIMSRVRDTMERSITAAVTTMCIIS